jgi:WD40 repeat protein
LSFNKREEITWNVRVYYGAQDKMVHLSSVSVIISADGSVKASEFHKLSFVGHNAQVRALSFNHSSTGEPTSLLTAGDDFSLKVWPLNLLEGDKVIKCTTYEGHEDDVLALDCKSGWVATGSKDKSVGFWDLNPAKTARAEKARQVAINRVEVGSVVRSVLLSDDATVAFVGCGDGSIKILKRTEHPTTSGWVWSVTESHQLIEAPVESLIFTQNVLVTGSRDEKRSAAVWKIPANV